MSNSELKAIEEELDLLKSRRERLAEKRRKLDARRAELDREVEDLIIRRRRALIPDEPGGDGSVIRFTVWLPHFSGGSRVYAYAAVKAGGKWHRTGALAPRGGESWESLIRFIQGSLDHSDISVLSDNYSIQVPDRD